MGRLFLGCWSSFLHVEHCSAEEAVGGPSRCPSWVSACARLLLPCVTQVSLTPAPTHSLTFSCQFWDGATGHLSHSLSLFKDTIEFLYLPMPGKPGMLRGADNIAAVCTKGRASEWEAYLLPKHSAGQPDHIPALAFISGGSSFSIQPLSKSQCSPSGSCWPAGCAKSLRKGQRSKPAGRGGRLQPHQELRDSGAGVAWEDGWVQAVVQKLVEKPGGAWKSSSWPGKGDKEKLDPFLNNQGSCSFRSAPPGA